MRENLFPDTLFRYVPEIDSLSDQELEEHKYYRGYPCAHGHVIRDATKHWCYHCAQKISSNVCGFDVNYLHVAYKVKYESLWNRLSVGSFEDCWEQADLKSRFCFPSHRSFWSDQKAENISTYKLLYQCVWGDVGKLTIKRWCDNPNCFNPLHMYSKWNNNVPPKEITPFCTKFDYQKLSLAAAREMKGQSMDPVMHLHYKKAITSPALVKYPEE